MGGKRTEACGRCSVSTVVDAARSDDDGEWTVANPFDDECIELEDAQLRSVVRHEVLLGRVKDRLDDMATRLIYG